MLIHNKSKIVRIVALMLAAICLLGLFGCRKSSVLEQIIYTDNAPIDNNSKKNNNNEDNKNENKRLSSHKENDDSDSKRNYDSSDPLRGDNSSDKSAADEEYDQNSLNNNTSTGETTTQKSNNGGNEKTEHPVQTPTVKATKSFSYKQIVGFDGDSIKVPQNVDTVTAVGDAAVFVQMLGGALNGKSRILASSDSFTNCNMAKEVFSDEGVSSIKTLWSGDGTTSLSDSSLNTLIELFPDVCFEMSGDSTFSTAQRKILENNHKICVVTLPKLNNPENIKTAVRIIGEVLGDKSSAGGTDAPNLAQRYVSWYDSITSKVKDKNVWFNYRDIDYSHDYTVKWEGKKVSSPNQDGFFTLFISDWDSTSYKFASLTSVAMEGSGVAVAQGGYATAPTSYYLSLGGVSNTAADYGHNLVPTRWHVWPLAQSEYRFKINGVPSADPTLLNPQETGVLLGNEKFKSLIVANNSIKNCILQEKNSPSNTLWKVYGAVDGTTNGFEYGNKIIRSNISGDYNIWVVPSGAGSWSTGSPESVLLSMWTASKYYGSFSDSEIQSDIKSFYSDFYRCVLTDSQVVAILSGK